MNFIHARAIVILLTGLLPLLAYGQSANGANSQSTGKAGAQWSKMAAPNFELTAADAKRPKAEISPSGDLLIGGRRTKLTAQERVWLLSYREAIMGIATEATEIGARGTSLAAEATREAFRGLSGGKTGQINRTVSIKAQNIRASALKLCDRMPGILETQTRLAASLPVFRPYARMTVADIEKCRQQN